MTRAAVNEAFVRHAQAVLGVTIDGWAGEATRRAFNARVGPAPSSFDPDPFFASVRSSFGALAQGQVDGFNALIEAMRGWPVTFAAYGLATAWHETAMTMQPVREAFHLSEDWRKRHLRYYPHYGRGYVQLTWPGNYERADRELELGGTLIAELDLAMDPEIAARILRLGMEEGWFTGKKLSDYLPGDYVNARRIINGTDKAREIAGYARKFEAALGSGGWS